MNKEVSFPIAKLLKEKGFNEEVRDYYEEKDGTFYHSQYFRDNISINEKHKGFVVAPTISDAVMWLYEKHGIWISVIDVSSSQILWEYQISKKEVGLIHSSGQYPAQYNYSPTEAYEAAISHALNEIPN